MSQSSLSTSQKPMNGGLAVWNSISALRIKRIPFYSGFSGEQHHSTRQEMVRISTKKHQLKLKNNSVGPGASTHNTNESAGGRFSVKLVASFSELPGYAIHFCFTKNLVGHHQKKI